MKNTLCKRYFTIKIDLKMKITMLFLLVAFFQLQANNTYSQKSNISMNMKDATIASVFEEIEKTTDFNILYKNSTLDINKRISVNVDKVKIDELMGIVLKKTNVSFEIRKKLIVLVENGKTLNSGTSPASSNPPKVPDQTMTVTGTVTDQDNIPLGGVSIVIKGSTKGVSTNFDGEYEIEASEGDILVFSYIGFSSREISVKQADVINVAMMQSSMDLNEVIVTATGARRKVEMGNSIANLNVADDVKQRPISNVSDLLQGQATGVQISSSGGSTGMGSRIRIRGSNSASLSNEPVIYVDGILINNEANSISFETGGQSPSRLNDINPEDIESIEIIKGPSAATLYGSIAANGVIRITTKKGKQGEPRWSAFFESGLVEDVTTYPKNYQALDAAGNPGFNFEAAEGTFVHSTVNSFQPLNDPRTSPFRTGQSYGGGLSVSGGSEVLTYFLSGSLTDGEGVLPVNNIKRTNFRGNFGAKITDDLKVNLTTGYTNSNLELPLNDNFALALMSQGLNGTSTIDVNNGWGEFTPDELFTIDTRQIINRFTSGLELIWQPSEKLNLRASGGLDLHPVGTVSFSPRVKPLIF